MNIYVVFGITGEYSDNRRWLVMAFCDEEKAKQHVLNADKRAKELFAQFKRKNQFTRVPDGANQYDPNMQMDYTGTSYYYETVQLEVVDDAPPAKGEE